jgi:cell division protein FtsW
MKIAVTILAFCVATLLALGMVMLYSSSMTQVGVHYLVMQLVWCALGLTLCVAAASLDYRLLRKFVWPFFVIAVTLLVLVLVFGRKINGARRWFNFCGMHFQPSELGKLALIIALAWYGEYFQRQMQAWERGIVVPGLFLGLVLALIFVEPDWGTTILLACVSGVMLAVAGVRWKCFILPVVASVAGLALLLWHDDVRRERLLAFLHPEQYKNSIGYQQWQAVLALGSGGWFGEGLGNSRQKLGFIPEHHTDFIFPVIGEELGLVAALAVVLAFVVIVICGVYISWRARDTFGQLLAAGISFLIGLQACINVGVVTSSLPNKGIALPFISYGGSNLLAMLASVGLLFSIARMARTPESVASSAVVTDEFPSSQPT